MVEDHTFVTIDLKALKENMKKIRNQFSDYKYYMGVVKANAYGCGTKLPIKALIAGGCNYLVTFSIQEAIEVRHEFAMIPILCLQPVSIDQLCLCIEKNISVTISSISYLKQIIENKIINLKIHLKIDTGMNRFGLKSKVELKEAMELIHTSNLFLEGIYTHIYHADDETVTNRQINCFEEFLKDIPEAKIPIIHVMNSDTLFHYPKIPQTNAIRIGSALYGFTKTTEEFTCAFSVQSEIIEIKTVQKGETVGYSSNYMMDEDGQIGIVALGYADGFVRANTGRDVFINHRRYKIVGNVCMNVFMVKIDEFVHVGNKVELIYDQNHLFEITSHLETVPEEVVCTLGRILPHHYKNINCLEE